MTVSARQTLAVLLVALVASCSDRTLDEDDPTDAPPTGARPDEEGVMYAYCERFEDCRPLDFCVFPPGEPGFCSDVCKAPGVDCDPAPGGSAEVVCIDIGADPANVCALDCAGGAQCPGGMACKPVMTNAGERRICF